MTGALAVLERHASGSRSPRLFVLSAPSGTGKDTVLGALRAVVRGLHVAIAATTRLPRPTEVSGTHYHFVSEGEFARLRDAGELLEEASYAGRWYGTPAGQVRDAFSRGEDVLLKIEVQGAATVRLKHPDTVLIFLAPAGIDDLRERLERAAAERGVVDPDEIARRLGEAQREIACIPGYDYLVVNHLGRLDETVRRIAAIIEAERARVSPRPALS
ncbi:MAG: guanylate kinase [Chloroflexota bacterium]|jgi:guanylate kinase|nr:guanylate kinase [Chloroflexota bacterium]